MCVLSPAYTAAMMFRMRSSLIPYGGGSWYDMKCRSGE